jgi:hypothetical protein
MGGEECIWGSRALKKAIIWPISLHNVVGQSPFAGIAVQVVEPSVPHGVCWWSLHKYMGTASRGCMLTKLNRIEHIWRDVHTYVLCPLPPSLRPHACVSSCHTPLEQKLVLTCRDHSYTL